MLKYICGSSNEEMELSSDKVKSRIKKAGLYDSEWEPEEKKLLIGSNVSCFGKKAVTYNLVIDFLGNKGERAENANRFFELAEMDVMNKIPGKLCLNDWYVNCYIIGRESGGRDSRLRAVQVETKVFVPYPFWINEKAYTFYSHNVTTSNNKKYAWKYPYRYANNEKSSYIINPNFTDSNFAMIIYGPVVNPQVKIGDISYLVNIVLEQDEYLWIDTRTKKIKKVMKNGEQINAYHNRRKGREFFIKIKPGRQDILWPGKFNFDLIIYSERSEPRWNG